MNGAETFEWRQVLFAYVPEMGRWEPVPGPSHRLDAYVYHFPDRPGFLFVATIKSNPGMRTGRGATPQAALDEAAQAWESFVASLPQRPILIPYVKIWPCTGCWRLVAVGGTLCDTCTKGEGLGR